MLGLQGDHLVPDSATATAPSQSLGKLGGRGTPSHLPAITAKNICHPNSGAGNRKWEAVGVRDAGVQVQPRTGLMQPEASLITITTEDSPLALPIDRALAWGDLGMATLELGTGKVSLARLGMGAPVPRVLIKTPPSWQLQQPLRLGQGCCSGRSPCSRREGGGGGEGVQVWKVESSKTGSWTFSSKVSRVVVKFALSS